MDLKLVNRLLEASPFQAVSPEEAETRVAVKQANRQALLDNFKAMYKGLPEAIMELIPFLKGGTVKWAFWSSMDTEAAELNIRSRSGTFAVSVPVYIRTPERPNLFIDMFPHGVKDSRSIQAGHWSTVRNTWVETYPREVNYLNQLIKKYKEI